jgi:DNA-binding LacI/PurR family transcriptional regulator
VLVARVKIKDVAREAGVSTATVSLVLNDRTGSRVSAATSQRVRDVAAALGYSPNLVARNLRSQTSQTVGFVSDEIVTTPFAVSMIKAAQEAAWERGHLLFLLNTGGDREIERLAIDTLLRHQVVGLVYACMFHQVVAVPPGLPTDTVFLDCRPAGGGYRSVVPDERMGAVAAVRELLDHGHRRVAFVTVDHAQEASRLRSTGHRDALAQCGVAYKPALNVHVDSQANGELAICRLLDGDPAVRPTGLFCFNDGLAMAAYRFARRRGLSIPGDLSVVGFDDQPLIAADLDPPLTTVALPYAAMGRWAVKTMLDPGARNTHDTDEVVLMPCPLVRRHSVGPPPR